MERGSLGYGEKNLVLIHLDPHVHSSYSEDSIFSPEKIVKTAYLRGLNAIAITDHNTIKGGVQAKSMKQDKVMIIVGSEIKTDFGDIIGLFLNEEIKSRNLEEVIYEIKTQDGIIVLPHLYRRRFLSKELLRNLDIIEGINGRCSEELNLKAQKTAKELKIPVVAGSDAHFSFELGKIWNVITDVSNHDEEELRKKLLNGDIEMHGGSNSPSLRRASFVFGTLIKSLRMITGS